MKTKHIILDTNLWISFLISKNFQLLDKHIENRSIKLIFSDELIEEFITVAMCPKFKKYFSKKIFIIYSRFLIPMEHLLT